MAGNVGSAVAPYSDTEDGPDSPAYLSIEEQLAGGNLAEQLPDDLLDRMANTVIQRYDDDLRSRADWEQRMQEALDLALQMRKAKTFPFRKASNVKFPLLSIAALQFHSRVYPAMIGSKDLVKCRVRGADPTGAKAARASRISRHMSDQCLEDDVDFEEEHDRMLMALPIIGCQFIKTTKGDYDGPEAQWVMADDLVMPYLAKSLTATPHMTHRFRLQPHQIVARRRDGRFLDKGKIRPSAGVEPDEARRAERKGENVGAQDLPPLFLEHHAFWDLDGDGYDEPVIITVDKAQGCTVRVVRRYEREDIVTDKTADIKRIARGAMGAMRELRAQAPPPPEPPQEDTPEAAQAYEQAKAERMQTLQKLEQQAAQIGRAAADHIERLQQGGEVWRIKPTPYFTKYSFIPSPDGGIYDLGFGALLGPINESINTSINQLIDSGTMNNSSNGFIGRGVKGIRGGRIRFEPFEWMRVDVAGGDVRNNVVPLPINPPSPVLFSLLSLMIQYAERLTSVTDMMQGVTPGQNTPATTSMAALEQGLQVFHGIFKRVYRGFKQEFQQRFRINVKYFPFDQYADEIEDAQKDDYVGNPNDIAPAADPKMVTSEMNAMRAQFLASRAANVAGYDLVQVEKRLLEAMNVEDTEQVYPTEPEKRIPPPPDMEIELKKQEEQRRTMEAMSRDQNQKAQILLQDEKQQADMAYQELQGLALIANVENEADKTKMVGLLGVMKETREAKKVDNDAKQAERRGSADGKGNSGGTASKRR